MSLLIKTATKNTWKKCFATVSSRRYIQATLKTEYVIMVLIVTGLLLHYYCYYYYYFY